MALTRKSLKAMGLTDEQVDSIVDMHTETVDGLKDEVSKYKADAEKLPSVQKELDDLKANGDGGYKDKYEKEHQALEDLKAENAKKESHAAKESAYRELLKDAGISEKRIDAVLRVSDVDGVELDDKGAIKDAKTLKKDIQENWADFISTSNTTGMNTSTPASNNGGGGKTAAEIMKISDRAERRAAIAANMNLFTGTEKE